MSLPPALSEFWCSEHFKFKAGALGGLTLRPGVLPWDMASHRCLDLDPSYATFLFPGSKWMPAHSHHMAQVACFRIFSLLCWCWVWLFKGFILLFFAKPFWPIAITFTLKIITPEDQAWMVQLLGLLCDPQLWLRAGSRSALLSTLSLLPRSQGSVGHGIPTTPMFDSGRPAYE